MPRVIISGPAGRLETFYLRSSVKGAPIALVLHSNPKRGGSMNDKPVYALYRAFADLGFSVMRVNFRGVGISEGESTGGEGELDDASACLNWLCKEHPEPKTCFVAGYSFGAYTGMQLLMRRPEVKRFISLSPPVNLYDFSFLAPCPAPGLVIQGSNDTLVPREAVTRFVNRLNAQPSMNVTMKALKNADHSFDGHLLSIFDSVKEYVERYLKKVGSEVVKRKKGKDVKEGKDT